MVSANNIEALRTQRGWKRPELARRMNTTPQQVERLEKGWRNLTLDWIDRAAGAFGVDRVDIIGERISPGDPSHSTDLGVNKVREQRLAYRAQQAENSDEVMVEQIDLAFGLGGVLADAAPEARRMKFSRVWLRHYTDTPPEELYWAHGVGDSMRPTIDDADLLLIDRRATSPTFGDKIWAIAYGDVMMVKRLRPMPDGGIKILSDNQSVPPEVAYDGELNVLGRVVAVVRKM